MATDELKEILERMEKLSLKNRAMIAKEILKSDVVHWYWIGPHDEYIRRIKGQ